MKEFLKNEILKKEIIIQSTDSIRKSSEYEKTVNEEIKSLNIGKDEFARYPGRYIFPEFLKKMSNSKNELEYFKNEARNNKINISRDDELGKPILVEYNSKEIRIQWDNNNLINSLAYKNSEGNDTIIRLPRNKKGEILIGPLGVVFSGRDIPYQLIAGNINKIEKENTIISEVFIKNHEELEGFLNLIEKIKKKITILIVIEAFQENDIRLEAEDRMKYRKKQSSNSEVIDPKEVEFHYKNYILTEEFKKGYKNNNINKVILFSNNQTISFKDDIKSEDIENLINKNLLKNQEIKKLIEDKKENYNIIITGPVASGKSTVAKILSTLLKE